LEQSDDQIFVKSHVARDLLQNAAVFKTDRLVVWEYVSNGLQYVDPGTNPVVRVVLDNKGKRISIADNGRGMDWQGLKNFFVMHGENVDRKQGRPGRGRFGTGKSAAFGIAETLRVTTTQAGRRCQVQITRADVDAMGSEDPIPVVTLAKEQPCDERNGTLVEIEGVHLRSLDQAGVIHYVERHLARWPRDSRVYVNHHECEVTSPPIAEEQAIRADGRTREILGDVTLVVKVSKAPLDEDNLGISIFSKGVWHETTLAGSEGRPMAQYIFGEIDVPRLDDDTAPIPPFDLTRSMRLNSGNEMVQAIYAFVGLHVEDTRRRLVDADRRRKEDEETKLLTQQADEIAGVINADFGEFRQRLAKVKAEAAGSVDQYAGQSVDGPDDFLAYGSDVPAEITDATGGEGATGNGAGGGGDPRDLLPQVEEASDAEERLGKRAKISVEKKRPRGGFRVEFKNMGADSHRAQYVRDERTIYVNLDHPQLVSSRGSDPVDDIVFRRLAYEVAFSEYAVALASELDARGEYFDPSDPIWEIRNTMDRVARRGAALYSKHR
jgi:hypothetical protein